MRPITTHATNPANEAIRVTAIDGPGPGGASHVYGIDIPGITKRPGQLAYEGYCQSSKGRSLISGKELPPWGELDDAIKDAWNTAGSRVQAMCSMCPSLRFQTGPVLENGEGVNGITHEALLAVLIDRLEGFQAGPYANDYNAVALAGCRGVLRALHERTKDRQARQVEGTMRL
jgi:hypothetical protein